jgi:hypothetical protein
VRKLALPALSRRARGEPGDLALNPRTNRVHEDTWNSSSSRPRVLGANRRAVAPMSRGSVLRCRYRSGAPDPGGHAAQPAGDGLHRGGDVWSGGRGRPDRGLAARRPGILAAPGRGGARHLRRAGGSWSTAATVGTVPARSARRRPGVLRDRDHPECRRRCGAVRDAGVVDRAVFRPARRDRDRRMRWCGPPHRAAVATGGQLLSGAVGGRDGVGVRRLAGRARLATPQHAAAQASSRRGSNRPLEWAAESSWVR